MSARATRATGRSSGSSERSPRTAGDAVGRLVEVAEVTARVAERGQGPRLPAGHAEQRVQPRLRDQVVQPAPDARPRTKAGAPVRAPSRRPPPPPARRTEPKRAKKKPTAPHAATAPVSRPAPPRPGRRGTRARRGPRRSRRSRAGTALSLVPGSDLVHQAPGPQQPQTGPRPVTGSAGRARAVVARAGQADRPGLADRHLLHGSSSIGFDNTDDAARGRRQSADKPGRRLGSARKKVSPAAGATGLTW